MSMRTMREGHEFFPLQSTASEPERAFGNFFAVTNLTRLKVTHDRYR
jgi:hypothetical protein